MYVHNFICIIFLYINSVVQTVNRLQYITLIQSIYINVDQ